MAVKKSGYSPEEIREHYKEATSFYGSEPQFEDGALPISFDRNKRLSDFDPNVGDSTLLGRNLLERYIYPPGPGYQAHHIVPSREVAAEAVRELLRDAGIKINEWKSGR